MTTFFRRRLWVPNVWGRYVVYYRDSPDQRGVSPIGVQRRHVANLVNNGKSKIIAEFTETQLGGEAEWPQLDAAITHCHQTGTKLLLAQIGRLRRDTRFMGILAGCKLKFMAVDWHEVNHLHVHMLIREELERRQEVGQQIREVLAQAKARGAKLGGDRGNSAVLRLGPAASVLARRRAADARAQAVAIKIGYLRSAGAKSLRELASGLNDMGVEAPRGGRWSAAQVRAAILRADDEG